jgi:hypothetical protein
LQLQQAGRKQHNRGWKHRENVRQYYEPYVATFQPKPQMPGMGMPGMQQGMPPGMPPPRPGRQFSPLHAAFARFFFQLILTRLPFFPLQA